MGHRTGALWTLMSITGIFTLLAAASSAPAPEPGTSKDSKDKDKPALEVAELLDRIIQPRFADDTAGKFGMSRVVTLRGHEFINQFRPTDSAEQATLEEANGFKRDYIIAFLHTAHTPGTFSSGGLTAAKFPDDFKPYLTVLSAHPANGRTPSPWGIDTKTRELVPTLQKTVVDALPRLRPGTKVETSLDDRLVVLRPVRAQQDSCLSCHTGAKKGDTLGVMVYIVNKTANDKAPEAILPR